MFTVERSSRKFNFPFLTLTEFYISIAEPSFFQLLIMVLLHLMFTLNSVGTNSQKSEYWAIIGLIWSQSSPWSSREPDNGQTTNYDHKIPVIPQSFNPKRKKLSQKEKVIISKLSDNTCRFFKNIHF